MLLIKPVRNASGKVEHIETHLTGHRLLNNSALNKGCAFTLEERHEFNLDGAIPHWVETLDEQVNRMYQQYQEKESNLQKNIFLNQLHDTNQVLFYKLVSDHLKEMLPIIYTPTDCAAVE